MVPKQLLQINGELDKSCVSSRLKQKPPVKVSAEDHYYCMIKSGNLYKREQQSWWILNSFTALTVWTPIQELILHFSPSLNMLAFEAKNEIKKPVPWSNASYLKQVRNLRDHRHCIVQGKCQTSQQDEAQAFISFSLGERKCCIHTLELRTWTIQNLLYNTKIYILAVITHIFTCRTQEILIYSLEFSLSSINKTCCGFVKLIRLDMQIQKHEFPPNSSILPAIHYKNLLQPKYYICDYHIAW
jgi:hypothetical protein